jgi:hypothetical protein
VILGFSREADENCASLGYYMVNSGNFIQMFQDNLSVPSSWFIDPKDGTYRLYQNFGKKLQLLGCVITQILRAINL